MNFWSKPPKETARIGLEAAAHDGLLAAISRLQPEEACAKLESAPEGLSEAEATARVRKFGPNLVARERKATIPDIVRSTRPACFASIWIAI
ncbi:hypothetical protein JQ621_34875 [Bradyrhizobium manausense]|uniref:cation-transporting P-type ATPase n=1 Tax=Bradyrhizobium manausense TaxID=989370 RepID=UPI001BA83320|nr:cation-transporting P-type ATPase [Bradyrhizobium manausense]MBR1092655.1 hypothetical protein [Bradyrhizobium manausense]